MRLLLVAVPLLMASVGLAQTQSEPARGASPQVILVSPDKLAGTCPVRMTAQQQGTAATMWTISQEDVARGVATGPGAVGSGVHVELRPVKPLGIAKVKLAVTYLKPEGRLLPVERAADGAKANGTKRDPRERQKTFEVSADGNDATKLVRDLWLGRIGGVSYVKLVRIDYADGSHWNALGEETCKVEPNRVLLVDGK